MKWRRGYNVRTVQCTYMYLDGAGRRRGYIYLDSVGRRRGYVYLDSVGRRGGTCI